MAMSAYASGMYGFYSSAYDRNMGAYAPYAPLGPPPASAGQQQSALLALG